MAVKKIKEKKKRISLFDIIKDETIHARAETNNEFVMKLTEFITSGQEPPPIVVFQNGGQYWLADGFYRYEAHILVGRGTIPAIILQGGRKEALMHAVRANADHGVRRTNKDKRRAVEIVLTDVETQGLSDSEIAKICNVSQPFVSKVRRILTQNGYKFEATRICADGRVMDVSNIGQKKEPTTAPIEPEVPEVEDDTDEMIGPSNHGDPELEVNQEPGCEENDYSESEIEETHDDSSAPPETEPVDDDQGLSQSEPKDDEVNDLDADDTTNSETTEGEPETDPEHDEDPDTDDNLATDDDEDDTDIDETDESTDSDIEIEDPDDNSPNTSDLDGIDPDALKLMLVHLQDTTKKQEEELKAKDNEIIELENLVKELEKYSLYLEKRLQADADAESEVNASLNLDSMDEEHAYSMV